MTPPAGPGHNGGPPLEDEHVPEWGRGNVHRYFAWKRAHAAVWKSVPWETMMRRARKAEAIGLTYEEYTLELLERGRYLGPDDRERIEAIKARRPPLALLQGQLAEAAFSSPEIPRAEPRPDRARAVFDHRLSRPRRRG